MAAETRRSIAPVEGVKIVGATGEPAFQNSWASLAGYGPFGFWRDHNSGLVYFQGIIQNSGDPAANSTVFTLPPGYRPTLPRFLQGLVNTLASTFVEIQADGDVVIVSNLGASAAVYFDGLFFRP
jgi:hypothetical protein